MFLHVVSGKADQLMQRLINDGNNSFADVLIQPISSELLIRNIPSDLRDSENYGYVSSNKSYLLQ
jgi:hypothetical protein